jgi:hypothetical protein
MKISKKDRRDIYRLCNVSFWNKSNKIPIMNEWSRLKIVLGNSYDNYCKLSLNERISMRGQQFTRELVREWTLLERICVLNNLRLGRDYWLRPF